MAHDNKSSPTPAMLRTDNRAAAAIERAHAEGFAEGREKGRHEIIDWLQKRYMEPGAPERGSVEGRAILALAKEAAEYMKGQEPKRRRGRK